MSDYKLVPMGPTREMVEAARQHHEGEAYLPVSLYTAMLAAAPDHIADARKMVASDVQGEPVAWRNLKEEKPADGQDCITKMKHGIIQGAYSSEDDTFSGYYWREMEWYATHWVPAEEAIYAAPAVQGEPVAKVAEEVFGSDGTSDFISARLPVGTKLYAAPQPTPDTALVEPVVFDEDAALSLAERTFSADVDEQLANDIIQYARRLHSLYAAPQPAEQKPDVTQLAEVLTELCDEIDKHEIHAAISKTSISWFKRKARAVLAAHRTKDNGYE